MTMRREPANEHPWRQYKTYTKKPDALKLTMGYAAENKDYKRPKKRGGKKCATL